MRGWGRGLRRAVGAWYLGREVEALALSVEAFDALLQDEPHLGQSLLATIARLTAQRLRATSDELRLADTV